MVKKPVNCLKMRVKNWNDREVLLLGWFIVKKWNLRVAKELPRFAVAG